MERGPHREGDVAEHEIHERPHGEGGRSRQSRDGAMVGRGRPEQDSGGDPARHPRQPEEAEEFTPNDSSHQHECQLVERIIRNKQWQHLAVPVVIAGVIDPTLPARSWPLWAAAAAAWMTVYASPMAWRSTFSER